MLAAVEQTRTLEQLESVIERGQRTFIEVGEALSEIQERRLYRQQGFDTFEDYCRDRWGWSRITAYRHMQAAQVVAMLPIGNKPSTESQARELVPLLKQDEAAVVEVWQELRERHGDKVTAEKVREAVEARLAPKGEPDWRESATQGTHEGSIAHVAHNSGNNEWYTPAEYIAAARRVLGAIDLDPASTVVANGTVGATRYYTAEDDGLSREWAGCVWMNPPYAAELIGRFTEKLAKHFTDGDVSAAIALVNNATETNWFQALLVHASAVCFPRQRIRFIDTAGNPTGAPLQGQAVLYLGDDPARFGREFAAFGTVMYGRMAGNY